ncbi:bone morphogenetic protein 10 [Nerophis ophidion]|uniref:bone morphogenetic protein 10 n=1 Tax=Nerophis ophidion TaxID=159077 RepID=UPI002ADF5C3C|nr:bone morphogenetic protein 10 [Nerophis ophidion]
MSQWTPLRSRHCLRTCGAVPEKVCSVSTARWRVTGTLPQRTQQRSTTLFIDRDCRKQTAGFFISMASILLYLWGTICSTKTFLLLWALLLLHGPLCGQSSPISNTDRRPRPATGTRDVLGGADNPSRSEQEGNPNRQGVLESLKEQFLQTFNLSGLGPPPLPPGSIREEPPEYMMELYNRFANDRTSQPVASIIRSFKNEDFSSSAVGAGGVRRHPLLFNVSVPHHERITAAELRLYTLIQTDRRLYAGVDRRVTIYEVVPGDGDDNTTHENVLVELGAEEAVALVELASRQVFGTDDGWEAFDLTSSVLRWRESERGTTHRLEVHIDSMALEVEARGFREENEIENTAAGNMKIDTGSKEKHKPLLIVFSDDQSSDHRDNKRELSEMIDHEANVIPQNDLENDLWGGYDESEPDEADLIQMRSNLIYDTTSRIRRNAKGNHCRRQPLHVEFKDIGWDSWILAPGSYDAYECSGTCSFPLTKHVTPTKHAIVQTLVNINSPQRAARACCVPTKLDPISLLYLDDTGVVTYKHKYEGMAVAECGCR